jgi:Uncharacterized alpha/beta hydrolase domain (DUF2235)
MNDITASAHPNSTVGVRSTPPAKECRSEKCEVRAHIGIFFDGTGNNQDWIENASVNWRQGLINWWADRPRNSRTQLQQRSDSNVARLFRAYRDDPSEGYFPMYVPGVGTPFREIGEIEPEGLGSAFGAGGDGRINYGMLHVLNSMYSVISLGSRSLIGPETVKALCNTGQTSVDPRTGQPMLSRAKQEALRSVSMQARGGLLMDSFHQSNRSSFFKTQLETLALKIANTPKPRLVEVFIDVFGFSRGAAQARTFCSWMEPLFAGSTLAGVTTHIRFLGLFDTVAAVGLGSSASRFTDGHQGWGDAPYLRVPTRVRHCEHYVAMHENRGAFPLEDVRRDGGLPNNCRQYRFPGMHSDVGGGYSPSDQGRGPGGSDAEKLSQIPLNSMFAAAEAAKVPVDRSLAAQLSGWDCFEVSASLRSAYEAFMEANGRSGRALRDCCADYLAWRVSVADQYGDLAATRRASVDDRADLIGANETLRRDITSVLQADIAAREIDSELRKPRRDNQRIERLRATQRRRDGEVASLSPFAKEIVGRARSYRAMSSAEVELFSNYCHDSYAGFKPFDAPLAVGVDLPGSWEPEGYLRYRTRYEGNDTRLTQREPELQQFIQTA